MFKKDPYLYEKTEFINNLLGQYWSKKITIKAPFYDYVDNGFKTYEEIKERRIYWVALFGAISTAITIEIVPWLWSNIIDILSKIVN